MRRRSCRPSTARRWPHYCSAYGPSWWVLLLKVGGWGRKTPQGQLLGSNFCPRGGLGPDFFSVFLMVFMMFQMMRLVKYVMLHVFGWFSSRFQRRGVHDGIEQLAYCCGAAGWWHLFRNQVQKLFSRVISNWVQLVYPCRSNPQSGDEWMQIYKVRFWWSMP